MQLLFRGIKYYAIIYCFVIAPSKAFSQHINSNKDLIIDTKAKAEIFAPGVVSTPFTEWATSFTPNGKTVYFSRGAVYWTIVSAKNINGKWGDLEVAPFSGKWRDTDPVVSYDGKKIFFISDRPLKASSQEKPNKQMYIWYVEQAAVGQWGIPEVLGDSINIALSSNYGPSISSKGNLYWCSRDREGNKGMQSFYSVWNGDHYGVPKKISIGGVEEIQDPFIAPDEKYLIFVSGGDMYISMRNGDEWFPARKLTAEINDGDGNSSPYVSRDGKTLYYTSSRIKGFYKRDFKSHPLDYKELESENAGLFNAQPNILMIPIHVGETGK